MLPGKKRTFLFNILLFAFVLLCIETIGYLAMWINSRASDIAANKNYFQIRRMLIGDTNPEHFPRYLTIPYLGYIQYPGFKKYGVVQNNEDGYRGRKIPLAKSDKLRVLCLGGSTTYGFGVNTPDQAFPAKLETLLESYIDYDTLLSKKYKGAEVLNAGLEAGTSAEELQQYLFKYRYYKPDIVVVHSGVNDALLTAHSPTDFQLDYTNFRRLYFNLPPLSVPGRWLLRSYFISFVSIRLFYDKFADNGKTGKQCFDRQPNQIFCRWTTFSIDTILNNKRYEFYPFYRNSKSLFSAIKQDSSILIVFPNALNMKSDFVLSNKEYINANALNESLSKSLCNEYNGLFVPFNYDSIKDQSSWIDDCHVNAKGEQDKAEILFKAIADKLKNN